jgi:hypothetical protein
MIVLPGLPMIAFSFVSSRIISTFEHISAKAGSSTLGMSILILPGSEGCFSEQATRKMANSQIKYFLNIIK